MNEFILLDAAILQGFPHFDALLGTANSVPLYADLSSSDAHLFGPWLLDATAFHAYLPADEPLDLPWRHGVSRLTTSASLATLTAHFESQRSLAMADGDRYYLRYADTRALDALERLLTDEQKRQLKGPVERWRYPDRFEAPREFGADLSADSRRRNMIVLSELQAAQLLEQQLTGAMADAVHAGSGGKLRPHLDTSQYRHVEASAAFVLKHGVEPFEVQRHIAAVAVESGGTLLTNQRFLAQVESVRSSGQWHALMVWRAVKKT